MDRLDEMIRGTLAEEDREILDKIGWEQSSSDMVGDLFRGNSGLLNQLLIFGIVVGTGIGLGAAWMMFTVTEVVDVVRWGLVATVMILSTVITKFGLLPSIQANRTLHAIKRLEMQIALLAAKEGGRDNDDV